MGDSRINRGVRVLVICRSCEKKMHVHPSVAKTKVACSKSCAAKGRKNCVGRKASLETRAKQRAAKLGIVGPAHWNWRGGNRSERKKAMARDPYAQWRKAVFERDNYACRECGIRGGMLHADHIEPWATCPNKRYDISNGRALCLPCHYKTPSFPQRLIPLGYRT